VFSLWGLICWTAFNSTQQLAIPRTNTGYGDRSFAVSGPSVWNSLPTALWMSDCSLTTFRTQLKALLFIWLIHCIQTATLSNCRIVHLWPYEGILRATNSLNNNNNNNKRNLRMLSAFKVCACTMGSDLSTKMSNLKLYSTCS